MIKVDLRRAELQFELEGETHTLRELTVGQLKELLKKSSNNESELDLYREMMMLGGLRGDVVDMLTINNMKQLAQALSEAK